LLFELRLNFHRHQLDLFDDCFELDLGGLHA
jgi:hypothetical protein